MTSAITYEKKFREFLTIKTRWQQLLNSHLRFHSENAFGQSMRPIAITGDVKVLTEASELLKQWNNFAKFAETYREEGGASGSRNDYWPVPFMITGATRVNINEGTAQAISRVTREKIISKLERRLNTLMREGFSDSPDIVDCKYDLERFNAYEFGTVFRRRLAGYADTIITVNRLDGEEIYRAGTWGVIIDSRLFTQDVKYHKKTKEIKSFYEYCTPIPCSMYDSGTLYLDSEVQKVKEERRATRRAPAVKTKTQKRSVEAIYTNSEPVDD